ncbi:CapA family protein [Acidobacteria bacterium AH-259-A15]|nr:CapA family protein [Acidobacteria bacterium AH-259-A15]
MIRRLKSRILSFIITFVVLNPTLSAKPPGGSQPEPGPLVWPWVVPDGSEGGVTLLLMGDTNIQDRENPGDAYKHVLPTLKAADVRFANLEGPFAGTSKDPLNADIPHKKGWTHSTPQMVEGLIAAGIDGVGVANNVTYPWQALLRSLAVLDSAKIGYTGGGRNLEQAHHPLIIQRKGVKFGFVQYTATFWPDDHAAEPEKPGVATVKVYTYYEPPRQVLDKPGQPPIIITIPDKKALQLMVEDIQKLRKEADIVVASYHWGVSGDPRVVDYQRTLARAAINAGADIVMGHGPHVLQPVEVWKGKPIFFSLANFTFDWRKMSKSRDGLLVRAVVKEGKLALVSCVPLRRDADNNPVLLDPNQGSGQDMFQELLQLGGEAGAKLTIQGKEIVVGGVH